MYFAEYKEILIAKENRGALEKGLDNGSIRFSHFLNRILFKRG